MEDLKMKFIKEIDLRDQFWKGYGYRKNILAQQFECPARHGNIDAVTVETLKNLNDNGVHIQLIAFEFKLEDIEKAFSQAVENSKYVHKSFIVVPSYKSKVIQEKYFDYFNKYPNIGVISVDHPDDGGKWHLLQKSKPNKDSDIQINQGILKLCLHQFNK